MPWFVPDPLLPEHGLFKVSGQQHEYKSNWSLGQLCPKGKESVIFPSFFSNEE